MDEQLPVVSLFSGAGGLDLAVERVDADALDTADTGNGLLRISVATDYSESALRTLQSNVHDSATVFGDIQALSTEQLLAAAGLRVSDPVLVVGGPPCTPFSKSGFWLEQKRESRDPNASLLDEYVRVVRESRPEAFVLENVQGLTYKTHRAQLDRLLKGLGELGYNPQWKVLLAADYGVPQLRRRVFVVGRRDGERFVFPEPTHSGWSERDRRVDPTKIPHVTAAQAFDGLPRLVRASEDEIVDGQYGSLAAEVPPGQNYLWHTERYGGRNHFQWRSRYWTFLLRLEPHRPSTTLQAQPGPWVGPFHWENVCTTGGEERARRLRVPEMLRLMSFPDSFKDRRLSWRRAAPARKRRPHGTRQGGRARADGSARVSGSPDRRSSVHSRLNCWSRGTGPGWWPCVRAVSSGLVEGRLLSPLLIAMLAASGLGPER